MVQDRAIVTMTDQ